mmetsp:Transcript_50408/g.133948  ORF Transcript_50408/g.133948 Transcript_50408/m.133948 type:complete len:81 (+) Transcript_50408:101-343(+)
MNSWGVREESHIILSISAPDQMRRDMDAETHASTRQSFMQVGLLLGVLWIRGDEGDGGGDGGYEVTGSKKASTFSGKASG